MTELLLYIDIVTRNVKLAAIQYVYGYKIYLLVSYEIHQLYSIMVA